jgi:hypothetical protein
MNEIHAPIDDRWPNIGAAPVPYFAIIPIDHWVLHPGMGARVGSGAPAVPAWRQFSAVQGPVGPWRGGPEGRRPSASSP